MTLTDTITQVSLETAAIARNTAFSEQNPALQLYWDSTSLGLLKECPRKYQLRLRQAYAARGENIHFRFGILVHRAFELYDRHRALGLDHISAQREVIRDAIFSTWNFELGRPWFSDIPEKNRETLLRVIVWYLDQFGESDPLQTIILSDGKPAVELHFTLALGNASRLTGEEFHLCGHIDRLVMWNDSPWVTDRKTTKYSLGPAFFAKYSPDNQMSCYDLAGTMIYHQPIKGIIIDAIQVGSTYARFQRGFVYRTPNQVEEWLQDLRYWLSCAESFAEANYWPMNDKACGVPHWNDFIGTIQGGCEYREICGADPAVREAKAKALFDQSIWDPLQVR